VWNYNDEIHCRSAAEGEVNMALTEKNFGRTAEGIECKLYTIRNRNGMEASVTDFGAILVNLLVPDKSGKLTDVVLGYDDVSGYLNNPCYYGATIGPNANRIANAEFTLEGKTYSLDANDGGNNLHSHVEEGYHKRVWSAETKENSVIFTVTDKDGAMGFPGNKTLQVTYSLDDNNALTISYYGDSDQKTVLNPTNHTYFNLNGHDSGSIVTHELWLGANAYTPIVAGAIPTGEIAAVAGTPMDFTVAKVIGRDIDRDFEQLTLTGGFDHNWVIDGYDGSLRHCATLKAAASGIEMRSFTTLPGIQFYAGNGMKEDMGKSGALYNKRHGLCLETQFYPDSVNEPDFPSCIFGDGKEYHSVTVYQFI